MFASATLQQFWTRPSGCRQIIWTFGVYQPLLFLYYLKRWGKTCFVIIHLQVVFHALSFVLFIALSGAVWYPSELRLTRIGLIWHQASVVDFHIMKSTSPPPSRRTCQDVQAVSSGSLAISLTASSTCIGPHSHA